VELRSENLRSEGSAVKFRSEISAPSEINNAHFHNELCPLLWVWLITQHFGRPRLVEMYKT
jgi:hypothetical protein